ncbi:MAG: UMP kinase [Tenericutes bacterium]|nr:MAG: UMP kinase [Mycoplasmatota bacterium]
MGMMATSINAKALESFFTLKNLPVSNYNSLEFESIAPKVDAIKADLDLKAGKVVIFGGGTGKPFLSTDTAAAMRAIDIKAEVILMAKNGVDGVYTSDPKKNADARHIPELTFDDVIQQNLQVVDKEAMQLLKGKNIDILLFNMNQDNSIIGIFNNESQNKTIIKDN